MKKIFSILLFSLVFVSCANHGKKIEIEGTKTELFYKGDGVTESDAKKTGDLLKSKFIKTSDKEASMQLTREGDAYTLRLVYDKDIYKTLEGVDDEFKTLAAWLSKDVFSGKKVNIALADDHFKDWKTIPYDEAFAKSLNGNGDTSSNSIKDNYEHESVGDLHFYWAKNIPDEESKRIADYIVQRGAFSGYAEFIITNENGRTTVRFPMKAEGISDPQNMAVVEAVAEDMKNKLFPDAPFSFQVLDESMNMVKTWDY